MTRFQFAGAATAALMAASVGVAGTASAATAPAAAPPAKATAPAAKPAGPSDKALIAAFVESRFFAAAFDAKNADKIMSYYTRQGLFVFDVTPPREYVGWASYKKDWQDLFAGFPGAAKVEISEPSVTIAGSVAYGHNIQDAHFTAADGATTEIVVRVTDVYRKIGGQWKIVLEHVSVPVDLATLKPDLLSKP